MKVYILQADIKVYEGDPKKLLEKNMSLEKMQKAVAKATTIVYRKGDSFYASDLIIDTESKRLYYPVGISVENYNPTFLGYPLVHDVQSLAVSWKNSLTYGNVLLRKAKFKAVETDNLETPEQRLFMNQINKELAENKNVVTNANKKLKLLRTMEAMVKSGNPVAIPEAYKASHHLHHEEDTLATTSHYTKRKVEKKAFPKKRKKSE